MKDKTPKQYETKEEKPQKAFEEFDIEQSIMVELDSIEEDTIEISPEEIETQEDLIKDVEVIDIEEKKEIVDASSNEFINIVRENIGMCAREIKEISQTMQKIEDQKNSESFWKKGENIRTISKNVNKMSEIQQKTLDLLVMFLGASGKMADDYDTILKTIDELGEVNGGEVEVLDYLLKIKKMVKEIKNNDERLKEIIFDNEQLKSKVNKLEVTYNEKVTNFEKNSKITISKLNRVDAKTKGLSCFILISYLLIITLGIIIYVKVFK